MLFIGYGTSVYDHGVYSLMMKGVIDKQNQLHDINTLDHASHEPQFMLVYILRLLDSDKVRAIIIDDVYCFTL